MKCLDQAVILCGGLGTRLRPFTDTIPKPMVLVNGQPFLAYLLHQLREQGIRKILLLTGYRAKVIHDFFGDGLSMGLKITYSEGPVEWETGRRIWEARNNLDPNFLLLYSDNYIPFNCNKLTMFHWSKGVVITLFLAAKANGNIRVSADGVIEVYDPKRLAPQLSHVEIGYMVVERDLMLATFETPDVSFSRIIETLATQRKLAGMITGDAYHSVSDIERWKLAERYLANKRVLLIDRDGTINRRPPTGEYITCWDEIRWIEDTLDAMRELTAKGFKFILITNQAGIGRGMLDALEVEKIHEKMRREFDRKGINVLDIYVCPHHWDDGCDCRKPAAGLFFKAAREHLIRMDRTIYLGDDPRDVLAASNAECLSLFIGEESEITNWGGIKPTYSSQLLTNLVPAIVARFEEWETEFNGHYESGLHHACTDRC